MKSTKEKAFMGRETIIYHSAQAVKEASKPVAKKRRGKALRYVPSSNHEFEELIKNLG